MFVTSKFKNVAPKTPKRDQILQNVKISELCNDSVACGDDYSAYCGEGSSIGVVKHGEYTVHSVLHGHGAYVRSMVFSPFKRNQLASCSSDNIVKIWEEECGRFSNTLTLTTSGTVTHLQYHPLAEHLLVTAQTSSVVLYDISSGQEVLTMSVPASYVSWNYDGTLLCATARDGAFRICDVRSGKVLLEKDMFLKGRDITHCWLGTDQILLGGFDPNNKERLFVVCNTSGEVKFTEKNGMGSGTPCALYDEDTSIAVLYCKGDASYKLAEISEQGIKVNSVVRTEEPIKGAALLPKLSLDVMSGEVDRLLITHHNSIQPTPLIVPKRSYEEFHFDVFPDTRGSVAPLSASEWCAGGSKYRELVSLNPALRKQGDTAAEITAEEAEEEVEEVAENEQHVKILSQLTVGHSVYKNIKGELSHKTEHFHGLKNVQTVFPPETNGFDVSAKHAAFLVTGAGGRAGVVNLDNPGQNNTFSQEIVNSGTPLCLHWDPFNHSVLAIGGDDAMVKLWHITNDQHKLQIQLSGHYNKVQFIKFHPLVKDVLASYSSDGGLKVWNCVTGDIIKSWQVEDVVAMNWNIVTGYNLLTVDKSGNVTSRSVSGECSVTEVLSLEDKAIRNARLECTKDLVIISALLSGNVRSVYVLSHSNSTLKSLDFLTFGIGTSIYVPFTDVDMNVAYLAARGESLVLPHEFRVTEPHIIPLATFSCPPVQYALAPITSRDVMKIQTARFYKLCKDELQLITFTVPRVKSDCFQDDIFHPSIDCSKPVLTAAQYSSSTPYNVCKLDLCPAGVERLSEVEVVKVGSQKSLIQQKHLAYKSAEKQRDEIFSAFAERAKEEQGPLEQDLMEGCEDDEWSD